MCFYQVRDTIQAQSETLPGHTWRLIGYECLCPMDIVPVHPTPRGSETDVVQGLVVGLVKPEISTHRPVTRLKHGLFIQTGCAWA